jgi:GMP synthase (glutamine-hydrolysing)
VDPVLVLIHGDDIPLGLLGEALAEAGVPIREVGLHRGESIPPLDGHSGLVVLGGTMGAYDEDDHPWLVDEKRVIREAHDSGMPMFGICLGVQLFADALGGRAYLAQDGPEIGHLAPEITPAGHEDPVVRHLDQPVVSWHRDTFDLPPGATLLAASDRFPHAFRLGSAVAIQSHPEAATDVVGGWIEHDRDAGMLRSAGIDAPGLLQAVADGEFVQREMARRLFGAWVEEVVKYRTREAGSVEG